MGIKEYPNEQLDELLKKMKENVEVLSENMRHYQEFIQFHEEQIKIAEEMIQVTKKAFEEESKQIQEMLEEVEKRKNYTTRRFPLEDVYLMCFREKKETLLNNEHLYARGLIPYLLQYKKILTKFEESETGEIQKQIPVYEERETFSKNPENIQYELEISTSKNQSVAHSTLFPGIPIKTILLDMEANNQLLPLEQDSCIGYEEIKKIALYAYENWNEKNGWNIGREDFFKKDQKVKKIQI